MKCGSQKKKKILRKKNLMRHLSSQVLLYQLKRQSNPNKAKQRTLSNNSFKSKTVTSNS